MLKPDRYRHVARGTEYELLGTAELQDSAGSGVEEGALLAIYRGTDGRIWARRHSEFGDGRFQKLGSAKHSALRDYAAQFSHGEKVFPREFVENLITFANRDNS